MYFSHVTIANLRNIFDSCEDKDDWNKEVLPDFIKRIEEQGKIKSIKFNAVELLDTDTLHDLLKDMGKDTIIKSRLEIEYEGF